jgi:hypothetical protein
VADRGADRRRGREASERHPRGSGLSQGSGQGLGGVGPEVLHRRVHGNLGPVGPDGSTKRAGVTVNPALYQAAEKVKDGEVVATPIQDGDHFVIVQRRGISDSPARGLETEAPLIRSQLLQRRYQERVRELLAELRRRVRIESYPERVDMLDVVAARDGEVVSSRRPGGLPRERHPSESQPRPIGPPGKAR